MPDATNAPMGANMVGSAATFRVWDPTSKRIRVRGSFNNWTDQLLSANSR